MAQWNNEAGQISTFVCNDQGSNNCKDAFLWRFAVLRAAGLKYEKPFDTSQF